MTDRILKLLGQILSSAFGQPADHLIDLRLRSSFSNRFVHQERIYLGKVYWIHLFVIHTFASPIGFPLYPLPAVHPILDCLFGADDRTLPAHYAAVRLCLHLFTDDRKVLCHAYLRASASANAFISIDPDVMLIHNQGLRSLKFINHHTRQFDENNIGKRNVLPIQPFYLNAPSSRPS